MSASDEIGTVNRGTDAYLAWLARINLVTVVAVLAALLVGLLIGQAIGGSANQGAVGHANSRAAAANRLLAQGALYWYHQSQHDRFVMSVFDTRMPRDLSPNRLMSTDMNTGTVNEAGGDCVSAVWAYSRLAPRVPAAYHLPAVPDAASWCSVNFGAKIPYVAAPGT